MSEVRIVEASRVLSAVEQAVRNLGIIDKVNDNKKPLTYFSGVIDSMYLDAKNKKTPLPGGKIIKIVTTTGEYMFSTEKGESFGEFLSGIAGDFLQGFACGVVAGPAGVYVSSFISSATGMSLGDFTKQAYRYLSGDDSSDITKKLGVKDITITNGYLKVTMPDGTVYARPFNDKYHGGLITGGSKNDVLFGGNGNDTLQGGNGSDILLGGAGNDTYNADNGDIVRDIDHTGNVHFSGTHLKGGKWSEKEQAYVGKGGEKYKLNGNGELIVSKGSNSITIQNYSKENKSLGIVLQDPDEVLVTVDNQTAIEKSQSMEFTISLNRALKKDETLILSVNGKEITFNSGDKEKKYTHTWKDNNIKQEDKEFEVSATITSVSEGLKASVIKNGKGLIKDDDRDPNDDLPETYDPLVIDLNGDGIKSKDLDYSINFDLNSDGFKEATSWIDSNDAFIAIDKNANAIIDNGSELLGDKSISNTTYGYTNPNAKNGFEALREFDSNNDSIIDISDKEFDKLLLWQDKNKDGISQSDEITKLSDKVQSINLNYSNSNNTEISTATLKDGRVVNVSDMYFNVDLKKSEEIIDESRISLEIKSLPNIIASGNLHSLHSAMSKNETLATMLNLYLLMDSETRKANINTLIYEWAGVSNLDSNSRTNSMDSRQLIVYEKLQGKPFTWRGTLDDNNVRVSATILKDRYQAFANFVYASLELQTTYSHLNLDFEILKFDERLNKYSYDFSSLNLAIKNLYKNNEIDELSNLSNIIRASLTYKPYAYNLLKENYTNNFKDNKELLYLLHGTYITGADNNDILNGTNENDYINGLGGNDHLRGGNGNDIYAFIGNFGQDSIYDTNGNDSIYLDINSNNIKLSRNLDSLIIETLDENGIKTGSKITIQNYFNINPDLGNGVIENIKFLDGTIWTTTEILANALIIATDRSDKLYLTDANDEFDALGGDDIVYGGNGDDTINGEDGNDELHGDDGNDTLIGGKGNDKLYGESGDDTYVYYKGDGNDVIQDTSGNNIIDFKNIRLDEIEFLKSNSNLIIKIKENGETITISDILSSRYMNSDNFNFKFTDERVISIQDIEFSLVGDDQDNYLTGYQTSDTIYGKKGNDTIYGGSGNDTYIYYKGDGNDTISDHSGSDTLDFKDITKSEVRFLKKDNNLLIDIKDTNEKIKIESFLHDSNSLKTFKFSDGTSMTSDEIKAVLLIGDEQDNVIYGYVSNDKLYGKEGNDKLYGKAGNDIIYGGAGNDTLEGEFGDDKLYGDEGDDILYGGVGHDTIEGGKGNDTLYGEEGDDVYVFGRGDGEDTISTKEHIKNGKDILKFKEGISRHDLEFKRVGENSKDLLIKIKDSNNSIYINNIFKYHNDYGISKIEFSDGSSMNFEEINKEAIILPNSSGITYGSIYADTIYGDDRDNDIRGRDGNDILEGKAGNDKIYGETGDDILEGGAGNDILRGDEGSDIYLFGRGDGQDKIENYDDSLNRMEDTIKFKEGITRDDLIFQRVRKHDDNSDFVIKIKGAEDSISVKHMFNIRGNNHIVNEKYKISKIEFSDGSFMNIEDINQAVKNNNVMILDNPYRHTYEGSDENDEIYGDDNGNTLKGNKGDDTLIGGEGFDRLYGGDGNDTYVFGKGDGSDTIYNDDSTPNRRDIIKFKEGITADDLVFKRGLNYNSRNDSLIIEIKNSQDSIVVWEMFRDENKINHIDAIEFSDGTFMSLDDIKQKVLISPDSNNNTIYGFSSDDIIIGGDGNDYIDGKSGNDTLKGGMGDDIYVYDALGGHNVIEDTGGKDKIYFDPLLSRSDFKFKKEGNDLLIINGIDSTESVRVKNHFLADDYSIDEVIFGAYGNDISLTKDEINKLANAVHISTEGNNGALTGGSEDNIFNYSGGIVSITDTGGNDKVIFANPDSKVYYSSNGRDLRISTAKINSSNNDVLEIKNFFTDKNAIIEEFQLSDYWTVRAEDIYKKFGKVYPAAESTPNVTTFRSSMANSNSIDINRLIQDINSFADNSSIDSASSDVLRSNNEILLVMNS